MKYVLKTSLLSAILSVLLSGACNNKTSPLHINLQTGLAPDPLPDPNDTGEPFKILPTSQMLSGLAHEPVLATDLSQIPVAHIRLTSGDNCTGVLVSPHVVVTAAHCFWDFNKGVLLDSPASIEILDKNGAWQSVEITDFYERSDIDDYDFKDIGLIRLKGDTSGLADPVTIATRDDDPNILTNAKIKELKPGEKLYSYGYASRKWIERESIATNASTHNDPLIREKIREWVLPTKDSLAYGGDSGGPLMINQGGKWLLVGVLQGKKGVFYSSELSLAFTWVDAYYKNITDAEAVEGSPFTNAKPLGGSLLVP